MAYQPEIEKLEQRYAADPARNFAQLAEAYRRDGRLDQALDLLRMHLQERPDYVSGLVVLGRCLLERAEDAEARETFEHVLTLDAEHIIALKALADIAERGGDPAGAQNWLQRLLEVDPMNEDVQEAMERLAAAPAVDAAPPAPAPAAEPVTEATPAEPAIPEGVAGFEPTATVIEPAIAEPAPDAAPAEQPPAEPAPLTADAAAADKPPLAKTIIEMPPVTLGSAETPVEEAEAPAAGAEGGAAEPAAVAPEPDPPLAAEPSPEPLVIERASAEYDVIAADLEPVDLEQSSEADLPPTRKIPAIDLEAAADRREVAGEPELADEEDLAATAPMFPSVPPPGAPEGAIDPPGAATDLAATGDDVEPFDPDLGWGTGERTSQQVTADDLAAADQLVEDGLAAPAQEIPGLEGADVPTIGKDAPLEEIPPLETTATPQPDVAPEPVAGLETEEIDPVVAGAAAPLEGLEPTSATDDLMPPPVADPTPSAAEPAGIEWVEEPPKETVPDTAEVPAHPAEPERVEAKEEVEEAPGDEAASREPRDSLDGLPVFLPEEEAETPDAGAEPAPVVTETMAEVYAKQGLLDEARDVYRQLLDARPGDERLTARLAELEADTSGARTAAPQQFAAGPGGESARALLQSVVEGRAPASAVAPVEPAPSHAPAAPVEAETPMDQAFDADDAETPRGAPTQPAGDEMSLATVFGDAPAPAPAEPKPAAPQRAGDAASGGFSFDEFFGQKPSPADAAGESRRAPRDTMADDEGDDAFRDWLKGLKG